jgi:hypothetical protein
MPPEWRLHVLEARLVSEIEAPVVVRSANMIELEPAAQGAVMAALSSGGDFPVVLVGEVVVCTDTLDVEAVIAAVIAR